MRQMIRTKNSRLWLPIFIMLFLCAKFSTQAQTPGLTYPVPLDEEHFPDAVFREEVSTYDDNGDGWLSLEECEHCTALSPTGVGSLEGIRYFYALERLNLSFENITKLDVSDLNNLTTLSCDFNPLTSLDVSNCTSLDWLDCGNTRRLTSLDLSDCTNLTMLNCASNQLTSLDLSNCTALTTLDCYSNKLTSLDLSDCTNLTSLDCTNNQLTSLDLGKNTALTTLDCRNNPLTSLDVSKNTTLTSLDCNSTKLTSLDLSNCTALTTLDCHNNKLTSLDLSDCTNLTSLDCNNNQLTSLDVSKNTALTTLDCYSNQLSNLELSMNPALTTLDCRNNQLTALDLSNCTALTSLDCNDNQLSSLNVNGCTELGQLRCHDNQLASLDVNGCTELGQLYCHHNQLSSLDVNGCPGLGQLYCSNNQLTSLDVSNCTSLYWLYCSYNKLSSLDLSANTILRTLSAGGNRLDITLNDRNSFDLSTLPGFDPAKASDWEGGNINGNILTFTRRTVSYRYETGYFGSATLPEVRFTLSADLSGENLLPIDERHFPDPAFRDYLKLADILQDGMLSDTEITGVTGIDVSGLGIQDLRGIGYFTELESLDCSDNQLTSLDLSANTKLETLKAEGNRLDITLDDRNGFDLSTLPGFDPAKASDWEGCTCIGNLLTFTQQEVTYAYATGYAGSLAGTGLESVRFHLLADRDPSTSNENGLPTQGRVYVQDRVIHTQDIPGEISIFTPTGTLLYRGTDNRIPVGHSGVYIVRNREQVWKVFVL